MGYITIYYGIKYTVRVGVCVLVYICVSFSQWRPGRCSLGNYSGEDCSMALPSSQARTDFCSIFPEEPQTYTFYSLLSVSLSYSHTPTHTQIHMLAQ